MEEKKRQLVVPDWANVEALVENVQRKDVRNGLIDAMHYILHYMNEYPYEHQNDFINKGSVPINMKTLREITGRNNADKALDLLIDSGILKKVSNHSNSLHWSSRYQYAKNITTHKTKKVDVVGRSLISFKGKKRAAKLDEQTPVGVKLAHLTKFLESEKLSINWKDANYWIQANNYYFKELLPDFVKSYTLKKRAVNEHKLKVLFNMRLMAAYTFAQKFADGEIKYELSESNNRLHSSIVLMNSSLRNFIRYDNEHLVEVDVNAMHPHILHFLLNQLIKKKDDKISNVTTIVSEHLNHEFNNNANDIHLMMATLSNIDGLQEELSIFSSLFEGDFYTSVANYINVKNGKTVKYFKNRDITKKQIMYIMYECFSKTSLNGAYSAFKKAFPSITKAMDLLKPVNKKNMLALLLQRLEGSIILEIVTKNIASSFPEVPIFTVHDAILTTHAYKNMLSAAFKSKLEELFNHDVIVKTTVLSGDDINEKIKEDIIKYLPKLKNKIRKRPHLLDMESRFVDYINMERPTWGDKGFWSVEHWERYADKHYKEQEEKENDPGYLAHLKDMEAIMEKYYNEDPEETGLYH